MILQSLTCRKINELNPWCEYEILIVFIAKYILNLSENQNKIE